MQYKCSQLRQPSQASLSSPQKQNKKCPLDAQHHWTAQCCSLIHQTPPILERVFGTLHCTPHLQKQKGQWLVISQANCCVAQTCICMDLSVHSYSPHPRQTRSRGRRRSPGRSYKRGAKDLPCVLRASLWACHWSIVIKCVARTACLSSDCPFPQLTRASRAMEQLTRQTHTNTVAAMTKWTVKKHKSHVNSSLCKRFQIPEAWSIGMLKWESITKYILLTTFLAVGDSHRVVKKSERRSTFQIFRTSAVNCKKSFWS